MIILLSSKYQRRKQSSKANAKKIQKRRGKYFYSIIQEKLLTDEMRESFRKSQEFLDLEIVQQKDKDLSMERIVTVEEFEKLITPACTSYFDIHQLTVHV